MPRNPSGTAVTVPNTFVPSTPGNPQPIKAAEVNANFQDAADEIAASLPIDGRRGMEGQFKAAAGSQVAPGITFESDPNSGIRWLSSGTYAFVSNGVDVATVTDTGLELDNPESLLAIGDFYDTARTLDARFLRRDGGLYDTADYPTLSAMLPALTEDVLWENVSNGSTGTFRSVAQGPDRIVAIANSGSNSVVTASVEGGDWEVIATIASFNNGKVAYGGGIYVAVDEDGKYSQSVDGEVWSTPATLAGTAPGITGMTFGSGKFVLTGTLNSNKAVWSSDDGASWAERLAGAQGAGSLNGVIYANNQFVAFGNSGQILTSPTGTTWTSQTTGVTANLYSGAYYGGRYVVVGASGTIITSSNGIGWTPRTSGTTVTLNAAAGNELGFIVVGNTGVARISDTSGVNWEGAATGATDNLLAVIIDQDQSNRYIVVGPPSNHLYGLRVAAGQFRVPNDDPSYGWIKALNEIPEE